MLEAFPQLFSTSVKSGSETKRSLGRHKPLIPQPHFRMIYCFSILKAFYRNVSEMSLHVYIAAYNPSQTENDPNRSRTAQEIQNPGKYRISRIARGLGLLSIYNKDTHAFPKLNDSTEYLASKRQNSGARDQARAKHYKAYTLGHVHWAWHYTKHAHLHLQNPAGSCPTRILLLSTVAEIQKSYAWAECIQSAPPEVGLTAHHLPKSTALLGGSR